MKYLMSAIALVIAAPAAAQTAPAQPHQNHGQHQQGQHQQGQHQDHHCCCCEPRADGQRPPCCAGMAQAPRPAAQPQRHDAH